MPYAWFPRAPVSRGILDLTLSSLSPVFTTIQLQHSVITPTASLSPLRGYFRDAKSPDVAGSTALHSRRPTFNHDLQTVCPDWPVSCFYSGKFWQNASLHHSLIIMCSNAVLFVSLFVYLALQPTVVVFSTAR